MSDDQLVHTSPTAASSASFFSVARATCERHHPFQYSILAFDSTPFQLPPWPTPAPSCANNAQPEE